MHVSDLDDDSPSERAQRMITPEVRGILKSGSTVVPRPKTLAKGESSEVCISRVCTYNINNILVIWWWVTYFEIDIKSKHYYDIRKIYNL